MCPRGLVEGKSVQCPALGVEKVAEGMSFAACDFTEDWKPNCQAPFVRESPLQVGCRLRQHLPLDINGTHMIIGEVSELFFPSHARREDGALALDQMDLVTVSGLDTYSQPEFGVAFRAARIDTPPTEL